MQGACAVVWWKKWKAFFFRPLTALLHGRTPPGHAVVAVVRFVKAGKTLATDTKATEKLAKYTEHGPWPLHVTRARCSELVLRCL